MPDEPSSEIEIYPMPSFLTLAVSDLRASAAWYCEAAGFTQVFSMPGPGDVPSLVHLRWVKYADLLLFPEREGFSQPRGLGVGLNYSSADVDELARRLREHNARILEGPVDRPWNVRELVVLDPDGYRLVFNGPIPGAELRSFDEIVADAAKGFKG